MIVAFFFHVKRDFHFSGQMYHTSNAVSVSDFLMGLICFVLLDTYVRELYTSERELSSGLNE